MAPPVRIFLSLLDRSLQWSHEVFRDVTSLRDVWKDKKDEWTVCAIHIGYDRPEYKTGSLLEIAAEIEKPVFLSESAKWALPSMYAICNDSPVAYCRIHNRTHECPLYLAVKEWGYELNEEDPSLAVLATKTHQAYEPTGWIKIYSEEAPSSAATLVKLGIETDDEYLRKRPQLDKKAVEPADNFRFQHLRQSTDIGDPFAVLDIAPLWLLDTEIKRIAFTVRLGNVFARESIEYVRDIRKYSADVLMKLPNFGRKSLNDLSLALLAAFDERYEAPNQYGKCIDDLALSEHLQRSLAALPDNAREIIKARLGADGNRPLTLQELGDISGVTRERIRQIEKKYLTKIIEKELWDDILVKKLEIILSNRQEPLFLDMVEIEDPWFRGFSDKSEYFAEIISRFSEQKLSVIEFQNQKIVTRIDKHTFEVLLDEVRSSLKENVRSAWSRSHIKEFVGAKCMSYGAFDLTNIACDAFSDICHFSQNESGEEILVGIGRSVESLVKVVLEEATAPIHYSEIYERVARLTEKSVDKRRVHSSLTTSPDAMLYGRGIYGLKRHLPFNQTQIASVLEAVENVIAAGPQQKQWHLAELLQTLYEEECEIPEDLDTYKLGIILTESPNLISLGKQVWVSKYQENLSTGDRIQTLDAIILILERAGHPLTSKEVIEKVSAYRGVKPTLQIHANNTIVRLSPNTWGLMHKDVPITLSERTRLLDGIYEELQKSQEGLHISELPRLLEARGECLPDGVNYYVFLSLCGIDTRFKVWLGHLIGLAEWKSPRRQNFSSAFKIVYEQLNSPISVEKLQTKVEAVLGRSLDRRKISNALSVSGGIYDRETGLWSNPNYSPKPDSKDIMPFQAHMEDEFRMASSA